MSDQADSELLSLLKFPIRDVDASVVYDQGHVDSAKNSILIRLQDSADKEFYFAILNDGPKGSYKTVLKNLPLSWDKQYGVVGFSDSERYGSIPSSLFVDGDFEQVVNAEQAIEDLSSLLKEHINSNSQRPKIALEVLRKN